MPTEAELQAQRDADAAKVQFTPEQQEKINAIVEKAMGRAGNDARAEAAQLKVEAAAQKQQLAAMQVELDAAKEAAKNAFGKSGKEHANADVAALQSQFDDLKKIQQQTAEENRLSKQQAQAKDKEVAEAREETIKVRKQNAIQSAAAKHNFVDPEMLTKLVGDSIKWEGDKFVVLSEGGTVRLNAALDPMTMDEFFSDYASKKPYLVKGDVKSGAGSKVSASYQVTGDQFVKASDIFGKGSNSKLANEIGLKNPALYKSMKEQAKTAGLIS